MLMIWSLDSDHYLRKWGRLDMTGFCPGKGHGELHEGPNAMTATRPSSWNITSRDCHNWPHFKSYPIFSSLYSAADDKKRPSMLPLMRRCLSSRHQFPLMSQSRTDWLSKQRGFFASVVGKLNKVKVELFPKASGCKASKAQGIFASGEAAS